MSSRRLRESSRCRRSKCPCIPSSSGRRSPARAWTLDEGLVELLPTSDGDAEDPVSGTVFKIERSFRRQGRVRPHVLGRRAHTGPTALRPRPRRKGDGDERLRRREHGPAAGGVRRRDLEAVGPRRGSDRRHDRRDGGRGVPHEFPPPTLESVVAPLDADDRQRLRVALGQLAEQDPLIDVRQDDTRRELSVSLYGEVQKEVIQATLANDFGVEVTFRETVPIHVERPVDRRALQVLQRSETRSSPPSGCASILRLSARGSTSECGSILAPSRCTSTRRPRASGSTWPSTSGGRWERASSAGRSRTAS